MALKAQWISQPRTTEKGNFTTTTQNSFISLSLYQRLKFSFFFNSFDIGDWWQCIHLFLPHKLPVARENIFWFSNVFIMFFNYTVVCCLSLESWQNILNIFDWVKIDIFKWIFHFLLLQASHNISYFFLLPLRFTYFISLFI